MKQPGPHRQVLAEESEEAAANFWRTFDERFLGRVEVLRAQFAKSNLGVALQGAEVKQLRGGSDDSKLSMSSGRLMGWSLRETSGAAAATVYIRDGVDDQGDIVAAIQLAPNESTRDSWFPGGLSFGRGCYVDVAAGSVEGAVYLGATD